MKETNQFQIFNHPQFGEVRTVIGNDGEPRFCLKDVNNNPKVVHHNN